jgi:hypothetical protein
LARNPHNKPIIGPELIRQYRGLIKETEEQGFTLVDKSHCNLFQVDFLMDNLPDLKLITIHRNIYGNVNSKLHASGWENLFMGQIYGFGIPNPFWGIGPSNEEIDNYFSSDFITRLCWKWWFAERELERVERKYEGETLLVDYDVITTGEVFFEHFWGRLERFIGKKASRVPKEFPQYGNQNKWKWELTAMEKETIGKFLEKREKDEKT